VRADARCSAGDYRPDWSMGAAERQLFLPAHADGRAPSSSSSSFSLPQWAAAAPEYGQVVGAAAAGARTAPDETRRRHALSRQSHSSGGPVKLRSSWAGVAVYGPPSLRRYRRLGVAAAAASAAFLNERDRLASGWFRAKDAASSVVRVTQSLRMPSLTVGAHDAHKWERAGIAPPPLPPLGALFRSTGIGRMPRAV
jgi:hypothetical protein